ncbi:MAG TPA: sigma-70 family RNA polymerase sigma factor [Kiritimatiellae bacterium]|nr:sigma-70 family RNA polymerase sigma factor [Kiritimatiellia bacterium]
MNQSEKVDGRHPALTPAGSRYRDELIALAAALPFEVVVTPEFKRKKYRPRRIRQRRIYVRISPDLQAIGRFLTDRGVVDVLDNRDVVQLFKEMHWCAYQIQKLAGARYRNTAAVRAALIKARRLVSEIEAAEEELFIANRRLVVACVKPFFWIGSMWLADFLQEGAKALSHAIRKFDFTRGVPFYAYAVRAVRNRLLNYFRDMVRSGALPVVMTSEMAALKGIMDSFRERGAKTPDDEELARLMDDRPQHVGRLRKLLKQWEQRPAQPLSLDAAMSGEEAGSLYNVLEDRSIEDASDAAQRAEVWDAIDRLPARMRYIMYLRFMDGRTLEETGRELNLTRARIKQIEDQALEKLRRMLKTLREG